MTMRRVRPSMRACTIQTLRPEGWMRRSKLGSCGRTRRGSLGRACCPGRGAGGELNGVHGRVSASGQGGLDLDRDPLGVVGHRAVGEVDVALGGLDEKRGRGTWRCSLC